MILLILAVGFFVISIVSLVLELRAKGEKPFRDKRFWVQVAAFLMTFLIFYVSYHDQQRETTEKAVTAAKQAGELEKMQIKSDAIIQTQQHQREKQELQLEKQEAQLEGAKLQEEGQKKQLTLQNTQNEISQRLIEAQRGEIELLNRLTLNHHLSGIELSFTPSPDRWDKIATAYRRIRSPEPDVSYIDAAMIAERDGDHWRIDFEPVEIKEKVIETPKGPIRIGGNKKLHKLSTSDLNNRAFEDVIKEASLGLRIEWGNGTKTALEPFQDDYPSAIYVSRNKIGLILRPPLVLWNLNELKENATVRFYARDYPVQLPATFTICSLDPAARLNQTVKLNWRKREVTPTPPYDAQMNRQTSGPHSLNVDFRFFGPLAANRSDRANPCQFAQ